MWPDPEGGIDDRANRPIRLVLLGDLHLYRLAPAPWRLLSKRALGQANLWLNRRKVFRHHRLHELIEQAIGCKPDGVLCTGDLTTTALPGEFEMARKALSPLAEAAPLLAVPGNHDKYTFTAARTGLMQRLLPGWVPAAFPHVQPLNAGWDLLALDAAVPRLKDAVGRLGRPQLAQVESYLQARDSSRGLVVLCHYPCVLPAGIHQHKSHALADADELCTLLKNHRAPVVYLHGHIHRPWISRPTAPGTSDTPDAGVPFTCINVGAPCMVSPEFPHGQGFAELTLPAACEDPPQLERHVLA